MKLLKGIGWGRLALVFVLLIVVQTLLNFAWVWIYSHFIRTDGDETFYRNYIFENRFWVNLVICFPLYFVACRWGARKAGGNPIGQALALFGLHLAFDTASELTMGDIAGYFGEYLVFNFSVLTACLLGGKSRNANKSL